MENAREFKGFDSVFAKRFRDLMETPPKTSQAEISKHTGVSRQAIAQYMDGSILPNAEKLHTICSYFDVPSDYLLGLTDSKSKDISDQHIKDKIGLSDEAVKCLEKVYHSRFHYNIEYFNYMLSNQKFMDNFPEQISQYFNNKYDDDTAIQAGERETVSDKTKISKYWLMNLFEELVNDCYNKDLETISKLNKQRPGRKRKVD